MKKMIILLIVLCWCASADARSVNVVVGQAAGAALSCATSDDSEIVANTGTTSNITFGYTTWLAAKIVLGSVTRVTALAANLRDLATVNHCTITLSLYTDNSGSPGSEVSGTAVTVAESNIADGANEWKEIELSSPTQVSAGTYWLVIRNDSASETTTTRIYYVAGSSGDESISTNGGTSWSSGTRLYAVKVLGCQ